MYNSIYAAYAYIVNIYIYIPCCWVIGSSFVSLCPVPNMCNSFQLGIIQESNLFSGPNLTTPVLLRESIVKSVNKSVAFTKKIMPGLEIHGKSIGNPLIFDIFQISSICKIPCTQAINFPTPGIIFKALVYQALKFWCLQILSKSQEIWCQLYKVDPHQL